MLNNVTDNMLLNLLIFYAIYITFFIFENGGKIIKISYIKVTT